MKHPKWFLTVFGFRSVALAVCSARRIDIIIVPIEHFACIYVITGSRGHNAM